MVRMRPFFLGFIARPFFFFSRAVAVVRGEGDGWVCSANILFMQSYHIFIVEELHHMMDYDYDYYAAPILYEVPDLTRTYVDRNESPESRSGGNASGECT